MHEDPHIQLMLRFQDGDEGAFRELFDEYKVQLLNFIYRYCQDKRVAEELTQEVFLRIYKTAATYRPEAKLSTWIYRIATNICLNEIRTGKYKYELEQKPVSRGDDQQLHEPADQKTIEKTDEKMQAAEQQQAVRAAIAALPDKQRLAIILCTYDQLSYSEIGQRLGCSEGAVKSIIFRAKMAIKDILKKQFSRIQ
ncbi:RNA polymerase sigma factor [Thermodesulfobacteriota bacterium]